jgi:DNA-3-methyladenine glycosylase
MHIPLREPLPPSFYERPPTLVAPDLLGKILVRQIDGITLAGRIVETEAYLGADDAAAHSARGKTKRNSILFERAGLAYVYQLRAYFLLNVTTETEGIPTCVLFRALEPLDGTESIRQTLGPLARHDAQLMNGPGKLCRALQINLAHYGVDFTSNRSPFYIISGANESANENIEIEVSTRIGITKAADLPYRYTVKGSASLSR